MAESTQKKSPVCLIVLGMAGSGKTSLVARLAGASEKPYVVNLDPACSQLPYFANIDIRDTVNYKEVMNQYQLGPNGAIVTSLNLFSTKFPDVLKFIEDCPQQLCVLDTPGQIEVFTWSVSGSIITESLASTLPTVILYVVDAVRSTNPTTFMSNMLYACSILYKTRLPFIVVMNKIDVVSHKYAVDWMQDFNTFLQALDADESYISNLTRSMALTLDEFYKDLKMTGVSAATGEGLTDLYQLIDTARDEYESEYRVVWEKVRAEAKLSGLSQQQQPHTSTATEPVTSLSSGREMYLRRPGNESSSDDSEGEELNAATANDTHEENAFRNALNRQKEMLVKRAEARQKPV